MWCRTVKGSHFINVSCKLYCRGSYQIDPWTARTTNLTEIQIAYTLKETLRECWLPLMHIFHRPTRRSARSVQQSRQAAKILDPDVYPDSPNNLFKSSSDHFRPIHKISTKFVDTFSAMLLTDRPSPPKNPWSKYWSRIPPIAFPIVSCNERREFLLHSQ